MLRYVLDTNIVSEPVKPDPFEAMMRRLRTRNGKVGLPSVAWHELVYGVERMEDGRQRSYLLDYLLEVVRLSMPILPYDAVAAQWHGEARAKLEWEGFSTPFTDGQIAVIAAVEDLTVVTDNTSDFAPFGDLEPGIHLENWFSV